MKLDHAHDYISQAFPWASILAHSSMTKTGDGNQTDQLCVYICADAVQYTPYGITHYVYVVDHNLEIILLAAL